MNCFFGALLIGLLASLAYANAAEHDPGPDALRELANGDWLFDNGHYRLRFAKAYGYAGCEVQILAATGRRLDQFWSPDLTFDPMCRFFDNVAFTGEGMAEIQGYITMQNTFVRAERAAVDGHPALTVKGHLQSRQDQNCGKVYFEKTLVFHGDHYDATLVVKAPAGSAYRYADVWWDVNDDWSDRYENSHGDWIPLRDRRPDAPAPTGMETFRSVKELDRGYGVWMSVAGPHEKILVSTADPAFGSLPHAGASFYDGMDEPDREPDKLKSHSCMALCLSSGTVKPRPFEPAAITVRYSVHFVARSTYERLYEPRP